MIRKVNGYDKLSDLIASLQGPGVLAPSPTVEIEKDAPSSKPDSPWLVSEDKSPIDDSPRVILSNYESQLSLFLRCSEDTTSIYVRADDYLGGDDSISAQLRIGSGKSETVLWRVSTNSRAFGLWRANHSIPFIKRLLDQPTLTVRVTPYRENTITEVFDISGLRENIPPLAEACHWNIDQ